MSSDKHFGCCDRCAEAIRQLSAATARAEELERQLAESDVRRREGRMLLTQGTAHCYAVLRKGDLDRLSRWCAKVDDYLNRTHDPRDILRSQQTKESDDADS